MEREITSSENCRSAPGRAPVRVRAARAGSRVIALWVVAELLLAPVRAQEVGHPDPGSTAGAERFSVLEFGDVSYLGASRGDDDGTVTAQLGAHMIFRVTDRLTFFAELSAASRGSEFDLEAERLTLKYDFSDRFQVSAGRDHTPIGFWNTAYHHGAWLQTTVSRPTMVGFGSQIIPIHFAGLILEGKLPGRALNPGYRIGYGEGRHDNLGLDGGDDHTEGEDSRFASLYVRPQVIPGLNAGLTWYADTVAAAGRPAVDKTIASAYVALETESPELIAEYIHSRHDAEDAASGSGSTRGYYLQGAYRLTGDYYQWKPYIRIERTRVDDDDPLLAGRGLEFDGALIGIRYDLTSQLALKLEYHEDDYEDRGRDNSIHFQVSFAAAER